MEFTQAVEKLLGQGILGACVVVLLGAVIYLHKGWMAAQADLIASQRENIKIGADLATTLREVISTVNTGNEAVRSLSEAFRISNAIRDREREREK